jgi:pimeloyl-ACP methyl ester carboxylesterase
MKRRGFIVAALVLPLSWLAPAQVAQAKAFQSNRISVTTIGKGPAVVLIHGLSSSRDVWAGTVAAVPGYRYHLVQINGFAGNTAAGNAGGGPFLAPVAEEIARYIKDRKLKNPALIGHSMGGSLAMMVAARHPEAASKVMVVDMLPFMGAMFGPPGSSAEALAPVAAQIRDRMAASAGEERRKTIEATIATMIKTEHLRAAPLDHALTSDAGVSARGMHDLIVTDLRPELKAIKVPLTVLYVRPPSAPITDAQMDVFYKMSFANAPQATLKRIPGSYHFIMLDEPAVFAAEVKAFLAR